MEKMSKDEDQLIELYKKAWRIEEKDKLMDISQKKVDARICKRSNESDKEYCLRNSTECAQTDPRAPLVSIESNALLQTLFVDGSVEGSTGLKKLRQQMFQASINDTKNKIRDCRPVLPVVDEAEEVEEVEESEDADKRNTGIYKYRRYYIVALVSLTVVLLCFYFLS